MTIDDLRRQLQASRSEIRGDYAALRRELNVIAKAKQSVGDKPLPWLGGAALVGWVLSGRRRRKAARAQKEGAKATGRSFGLLGILLTLGRLLLPLAQPALTAFAARQIGGLAGRFQKS